MLTTACESLHKNAPTCSEYPQPVMRSMRDNGCALYDNKRYCCRAGCLVQRSVAIFCLFFPSSWVMARGYRPYCYHSRRYCSSYDLFLRELIVPFTQTFCTSNLPFRSASYRASPRMRKATYKRRTNTSAAIDERRNRAGSIVLYVFLRNFVSLI